MNPDQSLQTWTDADYDSMYWHDNTIHGFRLNNPENSYDYELILYLDYIVEWICLPEKSFDFRVAPALLTFSDVNLLKVDFELTYKEALIIRDLQREEVTTDEERNAGLHRYRWSIDLVSLTGCRNHMTFVASGYRQILTKAPILTGGKQNLEDEQRK